MSTALLFAGALLAQSAVPVVTVTGSANRIETERADVAYEELSQNRNEAAIARIMRNRELDAGDPAAMINMGTAHARMGRESEARECFVRAIASRERYDLELADGSWMDSRQAARKANKLLRSRQTLALASRKDLGRTRRSTKGFPQHSFRAFRFKRHRAF